MRKLLFTIVVIACGSITAIAQKHSKMVKEENKTKKTTTIPQKVHNTFSKKKHYSGKKIIHKKEVETHNSK